MADAKKSKKKSKSRILLKLNRQKLQALQDKQALREEQLQILQSTSKLDAELTKNKALYDRLRKEQQKRLWKERHEAKRRLTKESNIDSSTEMSQYREVVPHYMDVANMRADTHQLPTITLEGRTYLLGHPFHNDCHNLYSTSSPHLIQGQVAFKRNAGVCDVYWCNNRRWHPHLSLIHGRIELAASALKWSLNGWYNHKYFVHRDLKSTFPTLLPDRY